MIGRVKKAVIPHAENLIASQTKVMGSIEFVGHLQVDGEVLGDTLAPLDSESSLTISEHARVQGQVAVPTVIINGVVDGDVYASVRLELHPNARVTGNVHYAVLEMLAGAEVNGKLLHLHQWPQSLLDQGQAARQRLAQ